jgi:hypothetical protein
MKKALFTMFILSIMLISCAPDKPSESLIQDLITKEYKNNVQRFDNVQLLNQWSDENEKGVYFIKVVYVDKIHSYLLKNHGEKIETIWKFKKEGNEWTPENYKNTFIEVVPL